MQTALFNFLANREELKPGFNIMEALLHSASVICENEDLFLQATFLWDTLADPIWSIEQHGSLCYIMKGIYVYGILDYNSEAPTWTYMDIVFKDVVIETFRNLVSVIVLGEVVAVFRKD